MNRRPLPPDPAEARCRGESPSMFFPMPDDWKGIAAAKMVCARCNVQTDCAAYAVRERYGVWGGLSERDRRRLRRILDRRGVRWPDPVELGRLIEGLRAA